MRIWSTGQVWGTWVPQQCLIWATSHPSFSRALIAEKGEVHFVQNARSGTEDIKLHFFKVLLRHYALGNISAFKKTPPLAPLSIFRSQALASEMVS